MTTTEKLQALMALFDNAANAYGEWMLCEDSEEDAMELAADKARAALRSALEQELAAADVYRAAFLAALTSMGELCSWDTDLIKPAWFAWLKANQDTTGDGSIEALIDAAIVRAAAALAEHPADGGGA